jgi:hypothetical protein
MSEGTTPTSFESLNLRGWPFNTVPSEETAAVWVGRPEARRRLQMLLRTVSRVPASQIVLLWAAYGAGKTHALKHLQGLARQKPDLLALYVATPEGIRSFLDIYRAVIDSALLAGTLAAAGRDLFTKVGLPGGTDLERALIRIGTLPLEAHETQTAISWLKAEKVPMRDLRDIGITHRLETTAHGIDCLNDLVQILQREGAVKVLLLLDEIQEIDQLDPKRRNEAVGGLHKVFDRNTEGLTMMLSFTTATQAQVKRIIGDALFDRRSEILSLPPISSDEAVELVEGLMSEWCIDKTRSPFPFQQSSINAVVAEVEKQSRLLTPREVIRAFNAILREADYDIEVGAIESIDTAYALERLAAQPDKAGGDEEA